MAKQNGFEGCELSDDELNEVVGGRGFFHFRGRHHRGRCQMGGGPGFAMPGGMPMAGPVLPGAEMGVAEGAPVDPTLDPSFDPSLVEPPVA